MMLFEISGIYQLTHNYILNQPNDSIKGINSRIIKNTISIISRILHLKYRRNRNQARKILNNPHTTKKLNPKDTQTPTYINLLAYPLPHEKWWK